MKKLYLVAVGVVGALLGCVSFGAAPVVEADVVIVGGTSAGIATAVQATRMGKRAIVLEATGRIGGLTTGGLGQTDIGHKEAFGGIARAFYRDIKKWYSEPSHWKWQKPEEYHPNGQSVYSSKEDAMWTFEPSAALSVLEAWERDEGLKIVRHERLDRTPGATLVKNGRIVSIRAESGTVYRAKIFVDATYEGDLLAAAGCTYTIGREANTKYNETINGIQFHARGANNHNFPNQRASHVDPYVVPGDPSSGLLPGIELPKKGEKDGDGDSRVQAYCYRMCLTKVPENRIPFKKPASYDPKNYELLLRNFETKNYGGSPWINSPMPNGKTDSNNRCAVSTDFVGQNWNYPEASYEERERIARAHLEWQQGLMWTLANDPRVPSYMREGYALWGTCKDEFADGWGDGWQHQLYVREARRLIGEYVMTEHNCRGDVVAPRPVAKGAYGMDSHHVRRVLTENGWVRNEGNVEDYHRVSPYPIDYGSIVPKEDECANLLVPICLSASHIAFGSIRMEPVFFALGQVAGTAASQAIDADCAVQQVDYAKLRARLLADGQVL